MSYTIDFVTDCGADPTGQSDCGPALATAANKARAKKAAPNYAAANDFTLHVPPGVYRFATTIGMQDMLGISTFRIEGHRAASIFLLAMGDTGSALAGFANMLFFELDGITFLGNGTTNAPDCTGILDINSAYQTVIKNTVVLSTVSNLFGILTEAGAAVRFENCFSANSACASATSGLWACDGARSVTFIDCAFVDNTQINGQSGPGNGANRLGPHVNTICVRGAVRYVHLRGVFTDEGCLTGIRIGDGTSQIGTVEIRGLFQNVPTFPGGVAGVHIRKARSVIVQGFDHYTVCKVPLLKLEGVDRADLCNVQRHTATAPHIITADADCKWLRVADPLGFGATDIAADVAIPTKFIDQLGTVTPL